MKNLCSQLCQELMSDILFISNNTHDESDASGLEEYLLQGRGWMLLKVIHHVGVKVSSVNSFIQDLSCIVNHKTLTVLKYS